MSDTVVVLKESKELKSLIERLKKKLGREQLFKILLEFFDKQAAIAAGSISHNQLSGQKLNRRTGMLARSVLGFGVVHNGLPAMRIGIIRGPALAYAAIQERGGTIEAKPGKALAIPQEPALTPVGVDKYGGPRAYAKQVGELRLIPYRKGKKAFAGLYEESTLFTDKDGNIDFDKAKLVYILVKRVNIKATHYLRDGFFEFLPIFGDRLAKFLVQLLRASRGIKR